MNETRAPAARSDQIAVPSVLQKAQSELLLPGFADQRSQAATLQKQRDLAASSPQAQRHLALAQLMSHGRIASQLQAQLPIQVGQTGIPVQRRLIINSADMGARAIPTRDDNPKLIEEADRHQVPEKNIVETLERWNSKEKLYHFPSWDYAFGAAASGIKKTAAHDTSGARTEALKTGREDELEKIADARLRAELKAARDQLHSQQEVQAWESKKPQRDLVSGLKRYASREPDRVAAVVVDMADYSIVGKGRSGDTPGRRGPHNAIAGTGLHQDVLDQLTPLGASLESWEVWNCGEVSAANDAARNGINIAGKNYLAGEKGGAHQRKCACGNCNRWVTEIPQLDLGGGVRY